MTQAMSATVSNTTGTVTNVARSVALTPKRNDDTYLESAIGPKNFGHRLVDDNRGYPNIPLVERAPGDERYLHRLEVAFGDEGRGRLREKV